MSVLIRPQIAVDYFATSKMCIAYAKPLSSSLCKSSSGRDILQHGNHFTKSQNDATLFAGINCLFRIFTKLKPLFEIKGLSDP